MTELRDRLQDAVGAAYRIEQELGGGGMSRVFLAEDVELGRRVVIKVLPPEMAAGVNVDRFRREIQLAARLQHPHIVPLLSAGSTGDLLYYTMPFIEGQSLRERLARHGELPVGEAARILREVADALAYAHRHSVVHRDIKPDNVLLSEGHAVVTDFGVAKAVSSATGASSLTSLGVALGTPAYMAPEQAVADPNVDHRADIYALGATGYEMLTGRPPFTGPNAQAVLSMHVTDQADPVTRHRATVPASLNTVIMRCLEKKPADRFQKAEELLPHFDAVLTPSGGLTPTGTQPAPAVDYAAMARRRSPGRVAATFGAVAVLVLLAVYGTVQLLGLPMWVLTGAAALLVIGLPVMLITSRYERRRAAVALTGVRPTTPVGLERHLTWRRAILGGVVAFAGLTVIAGAFMASRLLGIGPAATLLSAGVLDAREPLILSDFVHRGGDSSLAASVTELFRVDIGQSQAVTLMSPGDVRAALGRMKRQPAPVLDLESAREIALREGIKGVLAGEINPIGQGAVISVRLVSPKDETDLIALRETAAGATDIIPAITTLSRRLREKIGESLRTVRAAPSLERVTTGSLDALRLYTEALRAAEVLGDNDRALGLLRQAVAIDTSFAMAWRKIAVILVNTGTSRTQMAEAATQAFRHRNRLPTGERLNAEGFYYQNVAFDPESTIATYRLLLERNPDDITALNNLALQLNVVGRFAEAESLARHGVQTTPHVQPLYFNLAEAQASQGQLSEARRTFELARTNLPDNPWPVLSLAWYHGMARDPEAADSGLTAFLARPRSLDWQVTAYTGLAAAAEERGKLADAQRYRRRLGAVEEQRGVPEQAMVAAINAALIDVRYRQNRRPAIAEVEAALAKHPLATMEPPNRPYSALIGFFAEAGDVARARQLAAEYDRDVGAQWHRGDPLLHPALGRLALASGDTARAIREFQEWTRDHPDQCSTSCGYFELATIFDASGRADSALSYFERLDGARGIWNPGTERYSLGPTYRRLGELYEARGDREKAAGYYNAFIELWKDADPELQPAVAEVRSRLGRLVGERSGGPPGR